jgi:hypothetical protein
MALYHENARAINIFGALLKEYSTLGYIEPLALKELLAAKSANNMPVLYMALMLNKAAGISVYGWVLQTFLEDPNTQAHIEPYLAELLAAKDENGIPVLHIAFSLGNVEAINAYGLLLKALSLLASIKPLLSELLAARDKNGFTGPYIALLQGKAAAIDTYRERLKDLAEDPSILEHINPWLAELLADQTEHGTLASHVPRYEENIAAFDGYKNLLGEIWNLVLKQSESGVSVPMLAE